MHIICWPVKAGHTLEMLQHTADATGLALDEWLAWLVQNHGLAGFRLTEAREFS